MGIGKIKKPKYKGVKVSNTLRGLKIDSINKHLTLNQRNQVSYINNFYIHYGFVTRGHMNLLWELYWNYVMKDYRNKLDQTYQTYKKK